MGKAKRKIFINFEKQKINEFKYEKKSFAAFHRIFCCFLFEATKLKSLDL